MATYALTIAGVSREIKEGTWAIKETLNGRNVMDFDVVSYAGTYRPALNQEVIFTEDTGGGPEYIFGGYIQRAVESGFGGHGWAPIITRVTVADYNAVAERRYVTATIPSGSLKAALEVLVPYLASYGISLYAGQVTGPTLPDLTLDSVTVAEALDQLSKLTGYVWEINYAKDLIMFAPGTYAAPYSITEDDGNVIGDLVVDPSQDDYANRVIVRFTAAAVPAWAFLIATGIAHGETVTIGSTTYTWQSTLVNSANNVKIGATVDDSLTNLALALDAVDGEGTAWGAGTTENSAVTGYLLRAGMLKVLARAAGTGGNSIAVADTMANGSWIWEGDQATSSLWGGLDEALTNRVEANHLTEQGSVGIWEVLVDAADVRTYDAAQTIADNELAVRVAAKNKKVITYTTESARVWPGQVQTVTVGIRNLSGTFLITDVETSAQSNIVQRRVTAQSGTLIGSRWQDDAVRALGGGTAAIGAISGGGGGSGGTIVTVGVNGLYMGGSDTNRTRITSAGTYYRAVDAVDVIVDSYKLPSGVTSVIVGLNLKSPGGGVSVTAKCVSGTGDWSNEQDQGSPSSPVTATTWTWLYLTVPIRTGTYAYRIKVTSNTSGADVWMQGAMMQW